MGLTLGESGPEIARHLAIWRCFFIQHDALEIARTDPSPLRCRYKDDVVEVFSMRWFKPVLRNSISALLGSDVRSPRTPQSLEPVRQAMLAALGEEGCRLSPELKHRLSYLPDAHALWFARSELVEVLSRLHGEVQAVDTVRALSPVFSGLLPRSLTDSANRAPR